MDAVGRANEGYTSGNFILGNLSGSWATP